MSKVYGSIEAGGTKFVCAIGNDQLEIIERVSYPTTNPKETLKLVIDFFNKFDLKIEGIGIGSFGPIDIQKSSKTYGYIKSSPKIEWQNFDFLGTMKKAFNCPIAWTTDVNAACFGEYSLGNGYGKDNVSYYTVGTGVGGGAISQGAFLEGASHPEMGHMFVKKNNGDTFEGICPFHKDCLEGLVSGPALEKRTGEKGKNISAINPVWNLEANYIAQCVYNTTLMLSPDIIILGGGVMKQEHLLKKIKEEFSSLMNEYVKIPDLDNYIMTPKLGDNAGTIGCLALAVKESKK